MTPFEHLKAKLKHAQSIDADVVRVDIEELASVLGELETLKSPDYTVKLMNLISDTLDDGIRKGRAEVVNEIKPMLKGLEGSIYWYDGICKKLEQLKEQKNE